MMEINLLLGDCLDVMKTLPDNSVDSVVTDPPYGINFMNKHWDYDVPKVEVWQEVLRVLKPGGHILCACGTRTQHRMTVNIEDAGFEIRDVMAWIYGSGFPKSLNIGKAIDSIQGNEREKLGYDENYARRNPNGKYGLSVSGNDNMQIRSSTKEITKGNSEYEGWGTALKPAMELWTLARKPLGEKTVAENVLKWRTGGININGCRIEHNEEQKFTERNGRKNASVLSDNSCGWDNTKNTIASASPHGRFPANVIHDGSDEVINQFPDTKSGLMKQHIDGGDFNCYGKQYPRDVETIGDSGSASRFFYCAKASKSERNKGLEDFEDKFIAGSNQAEAESKRGNTDFKSTNEKKSGYSDVKVTKNNHPTVKPIALMKYLCKLITPPSGTVLDPFMGSGSTGIACKLLNFSFTGIEREKPYLDIARARISVYSEPIAFKRTVFPIQTEIKF